MFDVCSTGEMARYDIQVIATHTSPLPRDLADKNPRIIAAVKTINEHMLTRV
jgi:hypothetical protein